MSGCPTCAALAEADWVARRAPRFLAEPVGPTAGRAMARRRPATSKQSLQVPQGVPATIKPALNVADRAGAPAVVKDSLTAGGTARLA